MKNRIIALFISALFGVPAFGMPPNEWNPIEQQNRDDLKPWFQQIRQHIRAETGFEKLMQTLGEKQVYCSFKLNKNGGIEDLKVVGRKSSDQLEESILNLVGKALPIQKPPNDLPYQKLVVVRFWKNPNNLYPFNPDIYLVPLSGWSPHRYS